MYLFASILLICFIYANFLFNCCYYFITIFPSFVLTKVYTTSKHSSSNNNVRQVQYIYWWCIFRFVPHFFLKLYDLISPPIVASISNYYLWLSFIYRICNNNIIHNHQHQKSISTIDMMFLLHCINFFIYSYIFILRTTFCSNIILLLSVLNSQKFILIYIS